VEQYVGVESKKQVEKPTTWVLETEKQAENPEPETKWRKWSEWWVWRVGNRWKTPRGGFQRQKSKQKTQNRKLNRRSGAVCGCSERETG